MDHVDDPHPWFRDAMSSVGRTAKPSYPPIGSRSIGPYLSYNARHPNLICSAVNVPCASPGVSPGTLRTWCRAECNQLQDWHGRFAVVSSHELISIELGLYIKRLHASRRAKVQLERVIPPAVDRNFLRVQTSNQPKTVACMASSIPNI